jgi:cytochrome P450
MAIEDIPTAGAPSRAVKAPRRGSRPRVIPYIPERAFHEPTALTDMPLGGYLLINDPAGVKHVLVDNAANYPKAALERRIFAAMFGSGLLGSDEETWRAHRRIMAPAFDPRGVADYGPAIAACIQETLSRWRDLEDGATLDMQAEMKILSLRIISRSLFSTDSDEVVDTIGATMRDGLVEDLNIGLLDVLPVIGEARMRAREKQMATMFDHLDGVIAPMIAERTARPDAFPRDLLTRLVTTKDPESGRPLSAREARDEVLTIFMAGRETTSAAMSWIWFLLARNPHEAERLHDELDAVLGGRAADQEDLPQLIRTRRVVQETLRLYPAVPDLAPKVAVARDEVCGRKIAKGARVGIAPWVLHRHRRLWDDPERFDPDRFSPERSAGRHRFAYLPFGGGPRICIGQNLAMNQIILVLANLAQHYQPRLAPDERVVPFSNVTLRPKSGPAMILKRRAPY